MHGSISAVIMVKHWNHKIPRYVLRKSQNVHHGVGPDSRRRKRNHGMIWQNKKNWLTRKHSQSIVIVQSVIHRHLLHLLLLCLLLHHLLLLQIPTLCCLLIPLQRKDNPVVTRAVNVTRRLDGGQSDLHTWHFILQHTTFFHSHTHTTHIHPSLFVCKTLFLTQLHTHIHSEKATHFHTQSYTQKKSSHHTTPHSPSISALGYQVTFCYLFYCLTGHSNVNWTRR